MFLFEAPVRFQEIEIGRLQVGLSTRSLRAANQTTLLALTLLALVTLLAVSLGAYVLARRLQAPLDTLRGALDQIGQGRLDTRIRARRRDDFERVYAAYNAMADSLEARMKQRPAPQQQAPQAESDSERTLILEEDTEADRPERTPPA